MSKFRIDINGKFYTQNLTGVQRYGHEIVTHIDKLLSRHESNFEFRLLVPRSYKNLPDLKNIKIKKTGLFEGHLWEQFFLPLVKNNLLINLSGSGPLIKRNQFFTIHDAVIFDSPSAYKKSFIYWYRLLFFIQSITALKIFTVSEFSMRRLKTHLPNIEKKIELTYDGFEHVERIQSCKKILNDLGVIKNKFFLSIGSNNPNKNFKRLIQAIEEIDDLRGYKFIIIGLSKDAAFASQNLKSVSKDIIFLKNISDEQLKSMYINARALIFPSIYEGFGLPLLEAMYNKCPIIASNAASIPEICGDYPDYFDPYSVQEIKNAILKNLNDTDTKRTEKIADYKKFSWLKSAEAILTAITDKKLS